LPNHELNLNVTTVAAALTGGKFIKKKNKKRKKNIKIYSILNICAARTCCWSINTHHSQLCFVLLNFKYEAQNICYLPASCCQLTAAFGC